MHRLTGRRRLCSIPAHKTPPDSLSYLFFMTPRLRCFGYSCFSRFLAKTKCDSHYYRVLSSLLFLIPFGRRCKNVPYFRLFFSCCPPPLLLLFYRYFPAPSTSPSPALLSAVPCVHSSAKMDLFFTTWLLWLRLITNITQHEMLPVLFSFSFVFFLYAAHWSCKWFWLRFLVSLVFLTSFWQFGLLMFINETS